MSTELKATKPSVSLPTSEDAFKETVGQADTDLRQFFSDVARNLRYPDYAHMPVPMFRALRNICLSDLWLDIDDAQLCTYSEIDPLTLEELRDSISYSEVSYGLKKSFEREAVPKSLQQMMQDPFLVSRLGKRMERMALYAKDSRASVKAMEMLAERIMPTRAQTDGGPKIIVVQAESAALIVQAQQEAISAGEPIEVTDITPTEFHE